MTGGGAGGGVTRKFVAMAGARAGASRQYSNTGACSFRRCARALAALWRTPRGTHAALEALCADRRRDSHRASLSSELSMFAAILVRKYFTTDDMAPNSLPLICRSKKYVRRA